MRRGVFSLLLLMFSLGLVVDVPRGLRFFAGAFGILAAMMGFIYAGCVAGEERLDAAALALSTEGVVAETFADERLSLLEATALAGVLHDHDVRIRGDTIEPALSFSAALELVSKITGYPPTAIRSTYWASWRDMRETLAADVAFALESHWAVVRLEPIGERQE